MKKLKPQTSAAKRSRWTYILLSVVVVGAVALVWAAVWNPSLFTGDIIRRIGIKQAYTPKALEAIRQIEMSPVLLRLMPDGSSTKRTINSNLSFVVTYPGLTAEEIVYCKDRNHLNLMDGATYLSALDGIYNEAAGTYTFNNYVLPFPAASHDFKAVCYMEYPGMTGKSINWESNVVRVEGMECGNMRKEGTETCDDGNTTSADGCSAVCAVEPNYSCSGAPSVCERTNTLVLSGPSSGSVGQRALYTVAMPSLNQVMQYNCTLNFHFITSDAAATFTRSSVTPPAYDYTPATAGSTTLSVTCDRYGLPNTQDKNSLTSNSIVVAVAPAPAVCGNGATESGEACDDGNVVTETCPTYDVACTVCNSQCQSGPGVKLFCGDLVKNGTEECDGTVPAGKTCATEVGQGSTGTLSCSSGATGCAIVKTACSAAACVPATCFTDVEVSKVDDYLLGLYTLTASEMVKFDINCNGTVTDGDAGYIADHASSTCP